jgi:hypothetical protein
MAGSAARESEDSKDPPMVGVGRWDVEFGEDIGDIFLDRTGAHLQGRYDPTIGAAFGHQLQHVEFPWGEPVDRVGAAAHEKLRDDFGIEGCAAGRHPAHRVEEISHLRDPALRRYPTEVVRTDSRWVA